MDHSPCYHSSANCKRPVWGFRLGTGDVLRPGDLYDSTSGEWVECPVPGAVLGGGTDVVWVRPAPVEEKSDPQFIRGRMSAFADAAHDLEEMKIAGRSVFQYLKEHFEKCRTDLEQR